MDLFLQIMVLDILVLMVAAAGLAVIVRAVRRGRHRKLKLEDELTALRKLAFEDVTAFGEDVTRLDTEMTGRVLNEGAAADYHRVLDSYETAKLAGDSIVVPDDLGRVAEAIEDGRYAIACVRARVAGEALPTRRPLCFFDPRHGLSVADVPFLAPDGIHRQVPACALDTERVRAGAEPDARKVLVEGERVPYWQAGTAYGPYASAYFGIDALSWFLLGSLAFDGFGGRDYSGGGDHTGSDGDHAGSEYADSAGNSGSDDGLFGGDFGL